MAKLMRQDDFFVMKPLEPQKPLVPPTMAPWTYSMRFRYAFPNTEQGHGRQSEFETLMKTKIDEKDFFVTDFRDHAVVTDLGADLWCDFSPSLGHTAAPSPEQRESWAMANYKWLHATCELRLKAVRDPPGAIARPPPRGPSTLTTGNAHGPEHLKLSSDHTSATGSLASVQDCRGIPRGDLATAALRIVICARQRLM